MKLWFLKVFKDATLVPKDGLSLMVWPGLPGGANTGSVTLVKKTHVGTCDTMQSIMNVLH